MRDVFFELSGAASGATNNRNVAEALSKHFYFRELTW